jgi:anthranilate phosphoribosyltransferase
MSAQPQTSQLEQLPLVDIKPLLARMWPLEQVPVTADEIAEAISHLFTNQVSDVQAGTLLICLHFTGLDRNAEVMAKTAAAMLRAAAQVDIAELRAVISRRGRPEGQYEGGLVCCSSLGWLRANGFCVSHPG